MSILLFVVGAIALAAGAVMVGFGIPINEFSFGNTLIVSGTVAVVGGLVVIGLGTAVVYLRRIADALAVRPTVRASRQLDRQVDTFEAAAGSARPPAAPARVPFPTKRPVTAKAEAVSREQVTPEPRFETPPPEMPAVRQPDYAARQPDYTARQSQYSAPSLPNPDEQPVAIEDEVSLSPQHPVAQAAGSHVASARRAPPFIRSGEADADNVSDEPTAVEPGWRPPPPVALARKAPATYFDKMWPAGAKPAEADEPKSEEPSPVESKPFEARLDEPRSVEPSEAEPSEVEPKQAEPRQVEARQVEPRQVEARQVEPKPEARRPDLGRAETGASDEAPPTDTVAQPAHGRPASDIAEPPAEEPHVVAILKSGVVDGMGYTLYVDGSIEAELPQGTLRFASINELRSHLEKTS